MNGAGHAHQAIQLSNSGETATSLNMRRAPTGTAGIWSGSRRCVLLAMGILVSAALAGPAVADGLPRAAPRDVGMNAEHLQRIDQVVQEGLDAGRMPGCVVAVGRRGKLVFLKAYGSRQLKPTKEAMTVDTVFDLASLTKPIVTATSVMKLVEQGKIRLHDRVADHLPEFGQNDKQKVTVLQLLTHQGGLLPDNSLNDYLDGPEEAWKKIFALDLRAEPGTQFIYSDVGFMVLGQLVARVSGQGLHDFSREQIFHPLGMSETGFLPADELKQRSAATQQREDRWMQGEVHDPRAYRLGGVAGHAGLFSTAKDLSLFAQMMLDGGAIGERQVLAPRTVATMTRSYPVNGGLRGLGWDKRSGYSSNRGELYTDSAFGHGGFTGTAMWIDPELELFVVFLSNRVHPDGKGSVNPLAGRIGTIAAASIVDRPNQSTPNGFGAVLCGIDVLIREQFKPLEGKRVGLITNQTGITCRGVKTARVLQDAPQVKLTALFSPEHGLEGKLDIAQIDDSRDEKTGLRVFSLYGATRAPTAESLEDIDVLVFDIQDIGARFYTYISTMSLAMQAAAANDVEFVVLDRPNPINGVTVTGPVLDAGRESFVACHALPIRHGMTAGELARLLRHELNLELALQVVPCEGWRRGQYFDQTGLLWVNPSPNMRSPTQALLYPGIGLLETTNLSVGRGTDSPFELFGAPWLDARLLASGLNEAGLPGVTFVPVEFTPSSSKFAEELCQGIRITITDRRRFEATLTGWEVARQLRALFPEDWDVNGYDRLLASKDVLAAVKAGRTTREIQDIYSAELAKFLTRRAPWLLYE